jgi:uncharacterized protein YndB with AHSA1/START domain
MTDPSESADALVFECDFDEPPEKVWRALTETEWLDAWLTDQDDGTERKRHATEYEVLTAEPPRLLRYGCRDHDDAPPGAAAGQVLESTVTFELSPGAEGGTHLRLIHADFRITSQVQRPGIVCALPQARTARGRQTPITCSQPSFAWRRAA